MTAAQPDALLALALNPATRANELRHLWEEYLDRDDIAEAVAAHPNCPKNLHTHFMRYFPAILGANPEFQIVYGLKALENLEAMKAQNPSVDDLKSDFWNRRSHHYQYAHFMRDERWEYRAVTAQFAPVEFVEPARTDGNYRVRVALARRRDMPLDWWKALARDAAWQVRAVIARSKYAPKDVVRSLRDDRDKKVAAAAIQHSAAEAPAQTVELQGTTVMFRKAHAKSSQDAQLLATLAADTEAEVRRAAAANPVTPVALLSRLLRDEDQSVRIALAKNPALTEALFEQLALDRAGVVRETLAQRPDLPVAIEQRLMQDPLNAVLEALARCSRRSGNVLAMLERLRHESPGQVYLVFLAATENPVLQDNQDLGNLLLNSPALVRLVVEVPNAVSLERLLPVFGEDRPMSRSTTMRKASPDRLLPLLDVLARLGDAHDAYEVLNNPLFSHPLPENRALLQQILEALIKHFPKYGGAKEARKRLRVLVLVEGR